MRAALAPRARLLRALAPRAAAAAPAHALYRAVLCRRLPHGRAQFYRSAACRLLPLFFFLYAPRSIAYIALMRTACSRAAYSYEHKRQKNIMNMVQQEHLLKHSGRSAHGAASS